MGGGEGQGEGVSQGVWGRRSGLGGSISLTEHSPATLTDHPTPDRPFCYGQITWDSGPLPNRTVGHC